MKREVRRSGIWAWLAVAAVALSLVLGGCGGGGASTSSGGGSLAPVQASLQEIGIKSLSVGASDGKVEILEGSQTSALVVFELDAGVNARDLEWAPGDGSENVEVQQSGGNIVAVVRSGSAAQGATIAVALKVTNTRRGRYATYNSQAVVLAADTLAVGSVGAAGGQVGAGSSAITILPNRLPQPIGVKVVAGTLPSGERRVEVQFEGDIRALGVVVRMPEVAQAGLDATSGDGQQVSGAPTAGASRRVVANAAQGATCGASTLNGNPYNGPSATISSRELGFTDNGLGTQLWVGQDHFKRPVPGYVDVFGWNAALFAFRVKNSTVTVNEQTAVVGSFAGATLNGAATTPTTTTTVATVIKNTFSLDTTLVPANPGDCTAAGVIRGYSGWASAEPVLFVHGFYPVGLSGGSGTWGKFPELALKSFVPSTNKLIPFEFHWNTNSDFKTVAGELARSIRLISEASGKKVHVVAHSFGGVLSRAMLQGLATGIDADTNRIAIDGVASLVTLGSPHSGIFKADGGVDLSTQSVALPAGQDSAFFGACPQITCRQMGAEVSFIADWAAAIGYSADDHLLGGIAGQLASTADRLGLAPGQTTTSANLLPVIVGIGLTSTYGQIGAGDYLISFAGQRFRNHQTTSAALDASLLSESVVGRAKVTEVLLGFEGSPEVRPAQAARPSVAFTGRGNGYVHASTSSWSNLLTSDGNTAWFDKLLPGNYGLEAGPAEGCDEPITCFHAGYKLFIRAMGATSIEGLPIGAYSRDLASPVSLAVSVAKTQNLDTDSVDAIQGILTELQGNQWISGANVRWDLVPDDRLVRFNRVLGEIFIAETDEQRAVRDRLALQSVALNNLTTKLLTSQNELVTLDAATAFAFGQVLLNGAQASYAAVQIAVPTLTMAISQGQKVLGNGASLKTVKALKAIQKSGPWLDILKDCGVAGAEHYAALEAQLALPPDEVDVVQVADAMKADVSCLVDLVNKLNEPAKSLKLTALAAQSIADPDGTSIGAVAALTDLASGILDMLPVSTTTERLSGAVTFIHEWFDTYAVAAKLQVHVGEDVSLRQSEVNTLVNQLRTGLQNGYVRQMVAARAQGLFVAGNPAVVFGGGIPANGATLSVGQTAHFGVVNGPVGATQVGWTFDTADIATAVYKLITDGVDYLVTATADGVKVVWAYFVDVAGKVLDSVSAVYTAKATPIVQQVTHGPVVAGVATSFTVSGFGLTDGLSFALQDCQNVVEVVVGGSATERRFTCTFPLTATEGPHEGAIATSSSPFGAPLFSFTVTLSRPSVGSVSPPNTVRTIATSFDIAGQNLPTSGLTVVPLNDTRSNCQAPNNMTANGFGVSCELYKVGPQTLEVRQGTQVLGSVTVNVASNVTGVTWTSPSTTNSGTVKFGETVTFNVAGENLLADEKMGFAVEKCGVSNTEVPGTKSNALRTFTCLFNNEAGAVAGQMPGVVKDALGGQVLFEGWKVPVEVPVVTASTIVVPASTFLPSSLNIAVSEGVSQGCQVGMVTNAPPYNGRANAGDWSVPVTTAGTYRIEVEYSAALSRPVEALMDGVLVNANALADTNGTWCASPTIVRTVGTVNLTAGSHIFRMQRSDVFPHLKEIRFVPDGIAAGPYTKISNAGAALPDSAALGDGPNDWACTRDNASNRLWEVKTASGVRQYGRIFTFYTSTNEVQKWLQETNTYVNPTIADLASLDNSQTYIDSANSATLCGASNWNISLPSSAFPVQYFGTTAGTYWTGEVGYGCQFGGCTVPETAMGRYDSVPYTPHSDSARRSGMLNIWISSPPR